MIEIVEDSKNNKLKIFIYKKETLILLQKLNVKMKLENAEIVQKMEIFTANIEKSELNWKIKNDEFENDDLILNLGDLFCNHGIKINYKRMNMLPHEEWRELLDCWSCHNNEFKHLLDLEIKLIPGRILISDFYLLISPDDRPICCKDLQKFYFNEIKTQLNTSQIIFRFFNDFFSDKNICKIKFNEKFYEIKYFYKCKIIKDFSKNSINIEKFQTINALKIGVKELVFDENNTFEYLKNINDFYSEYIIKEIMNWKLSIKIMNYQISFITCQD